MNTKSNAGIPRRSNGRPPRRAASVHWVDAPPPDTRGGREHDIDHQEIAAVLRQHPGRWAMLLRIASASVIRGVAYRPEDSFEAVTRHGVVYARYVGDPS